MYTSTLKQRNQLPYQVLNAKLTKFTFEMSVIATIIIVYLIIK